MKKLRIIEIYTIHDTDEGKVEIQDASGMVLVIARDMQDALDQMSKEIMLDHEHGSLQMSFNDRGDVWTEV